MPSTKLIDLAETYPGGPLMGMSDSKSGKEKVHYPTISLDADDFGDLPTDGSRFYAVICGRVSRFENPTDGEATMSVELHDMGQISEAEAKKLVGTLPKDDEAASSKKMPGFRETMKGVVAGKNQTDTADDAAEGGDEY